LAHVIDVAFSKVYVRQSDAGSCQKGHGDMGVQKSRKL